MKIKSLLAIALMAGSAIYANSTEIPSGITTLYLVGEASPSGWSLDEAPAFTSDGDGIFTWTGDLKTGQFKITLSNTSFNALVSSVQDNEGMKINVPMGMAYCDGSEDNDWKWYNNEAGKYTLIVNLKDATLTATQEIKELYMVGGAVPGSGWDRGNAPELTRGADGIFTWTGMLDAGDFKFVTSRSSWNSVVAMNVDEAVVIGKKMPVQLNGEGGNRDYKWTIGTAGKYTIAVDTNAMTLLVTDPDTTGIEAVGTSDNTPAVYYDLSGVRVDNPSNGVYICVRNGVVSKVKL